MINQSICLHILTLAKKDERLDLLFQGLTLGLRNDGPSITTKHSEAWHIRLGSTPSLFRRYMIKCLMRSAILNVVCTIDCLNIEDRKQVLRIHHTTSHLLQCSILPSCNSILFLGCKELNVDELYHAS